MGRVDGKVALISGGARGMGAADARMLVAEGANQIQGPDLSVDAKTRRMAESVIAGLANAA